MATIRAPAATITPFATQARTEFFMASTSPAKQVALVTGASSGMGKETAKRLLQEGLVVYVAAQPIHHQVCVVATDKTRRLELVQPRPAGCGRQVHQLGQFVFAELTVLLNRGKNANINGIKTDFSHGFDFVGRIENQPFGGDYGTGLGLNESPEVAPTGGSRRRPIKEHCLLKIQPP
jgi:hypothetical protein